MSQRQDEHRNTMTHRWALAWMAVGAVAVAYPLWRPTQLTPSMLGDFSWLRGNDKGTRSRGQAKTKPVPPHPVARRRALVLPNKPSMDTAGVPPMTLSLIASEELGIDLNTIGRLEPPRPELRLQLVGLSSLPGQRLTIPLDEH